MHYAIFLPSLHLYSFHSPISQTPPIFFLARLFPCMPILNFIFPNIWYKPEYLSLSEASNSSPLKVILHWLYISQTQELWSYYYLSSISTFYWHLSDIPFYATPHLIQQRELQDPYNNGAFYPVLPWFSFPIFRGWETCPFNPFTVAGTNMVSKLLDC